MTSRSQARNIVTVTSLTEALLTKRRAVDFCRVATALCHAAR
ncbi:putative leader peptide [Spinactinospora alkalitolerans]